ncbi:MAG: NAD(P)/FAD-dependent oxidoreductase [Clostridia bacterium]
MDNYDVIVIGAGNGGLTAAIKLALEGKKVALFEKHNVTGGFATSFVRGRFEFEASLHELCDLGTKEDLGEVGKLFTELGVYDKIDWVPLTEAFRTVTLEGEKIDVTFPMDKKGFIDTMEKYVPNSRVPMEEFFDIGEEVMECLYYFTSVNGKTDNIKMLKEHSRYIKLAPYDVNTVMDKIGMPKLARDIINSYWCYIGIDCDNLSFVLFAGMVAMYAKHGCHTPKKTSHEISTALAERFTELGGKLFLNTEIIKINVEKGAVKGVVTSNGKNIFANHIICNCSAHNVYGKLIDSNLVPEKALRNTNARKLGARGFTAFIGLDKSPEELGIKNHNVFIYNTLDTVKEFENTKTLDNGNSQAACCLNLANPDCSPKGTTIMYFTRLFNSDIWETVSEKDYVKVKNDMAYKLISAYEKATGATLLGHIEEIEVASPMTYARYTGTPQGAIYGYLAEEWDSLMPRMLSMYDEEPIKNIRFSGGFAMRLIGYSSAYMSGLLAANLVLDDMGGENNE